MSRRHEAPRLQLAKWKKRKGDTWEEDQKKTKKKRGKVNVRQVKKKK